MSDNCEYCGAPVEGGIYARPDIGWDQELARTLQGQVVVWDTKRNDRISMGVVEEALKAGILLSRCTLVEYTPRCIDSWADNLEEATINGLPGFGTPRMGPQTVPYNRIHDLRRWGGGTIKDYNEWYERLGGTIEEYSKWRDAEE